MNLVAVFAMAIITVSSPVVCAADRYGAEDGNSENSYSSQTVQSKPNSSNAQNSDQFVKIVKTDIGEVYTTKDGKTLYTFTNDPTSVSTCYGSCATSWPPAMASTSAKPWGQFSVIERNDKTRQWAYKGQPLYTWVGDQKEGDIRGHGVHKVWYAAQPKP